MYDVDTAELAQRYQAGAGLEELAAEVGCHHVTLWSYFREDGIELRPRGRPKGSGEVTEIAEKRLAEVRAMMPLKRGDMTVLADRWGISNAAAWHFIANHKHRL